MSFRTTLVLRTWFLTNTTYASWLPGDARGSVASVRDERPGDPLTEARVEHDRPGEPYEESLPCLREASAGRVRGGAVYLQLGHAEALLEQFRETAAYRGWDLLAAAVMANHFHLVVTVSGDPDPLKVLADFKAYGSRALNRQFGPPAGRQWWTTNGSKRKLADARAVAAVTQYVLHRQPRPLVVWSPDLGRLV